MDAKEIIKRFWMEEIYACITIIYLFRLNDLNKRLLFEKFDNEFELLLYDRGTPIIYFAMAMLLFIAGVLVIWQECKKVRYQRCELEEIIAAIIGIVVVVILLILIIHFIKIPILKAVLCAVTLVLFVGLSATH